jgi:hypothetical protein
LNLDQEGNETTKQKEKTNNHTEMVNACDDGDNNNIINIIRLQTTWNVVGK